MTDAKRSESGLGLVGELRTRGFPARPGAGRAVALGRREKVASALSKGCSKRQVSELLRDQDVLAIGYETFSRYVGEALAANAVVGSSNGRRGGRRCR